MVLLGLVVMHRVYQFKEFSEQMAHCSTPLDHRPDLLQYKDVDIVPTRQKILLAPDTIEYI